MLLPVPPVPATPNASNTPGMFPASGPLHLRFPLPGVPILRCHHGFLLHPHHSNVSPPTLIFNTAKPAPPPPTLCPFPVVCFSMALITILNITHFCLVISNHPLSLSQQECKLPPGQAFCLSCSVLCLRPLQMYTGNVYYL